MRNRTRAWVLIAAAFFGLQATGQSQEPPKEALSNDGVVALVQAGLAPAVIVAKIRASRCEFDTSATALQQLKANSVPDEVLLAMIESGAKPAEVSPSPKPARIKDELSGSFQRLKNGVVTVWSEFGHGTGFIVDLSGLVVTNHHVVGPSEYIAVQFDEDRKVAAVLLAADPIKDVAVLWAGIGAIPESIAVPLAAPMGGAPTVEEGERVFTIGSPLSQRKIITTGVVSKVEPHAILSDVNINPGNSGGPLFNSLNEVVGITTFGERSDRGPGPGVSGIVRIEEAIPLLEQAKKRMASVEPPSSRFLPVEPRDAFPVEAIKAAGPGFDVSPYVFGMGNYDVAVVTPMVAAGQGAAERAAAKEKEKRTKKKDQQFDPLADLFSWGEYVGQLRPVVTIRATPKLAETFWSAFGRGMAAAGGAVYTGAAKMRFKTDFYRMRLYCGGQEMEPILPAKIPHLVNVKTAFVNATDATYEGLYTYPVDALSPNCGTVTLQVFSEKDPRKAETKVLDPKTLARVWSDFEPWRQLSH